MPQGPGTLPAGECVHALPVRDLRTHVPSPSVTGARRPVRLHVLALPLAGEAGAGAVGSGSARTVGAADEDGRVALLRAAACAAETALFDSGLAPQLHVHSPTPEPPTAAAGAALFEAGRPSVVLFVGTAHVPLADQTLALASEKLGARLTHAPALAAALRRSAGRWAPGGVSAADAAIVDHVSLLVVMDAHAGAIGQCFRELAPAVLALAQELNA
jgi:hypothetical protein